MKKTLLTILSILLMAICSSQTTVLESSNRHEGSPGQENQKEQPAPEKYGNIFNDNLTMFTLPSTGATSPNTRAPSNYWKSQRTEYLITAAEMASSGFPSGSLISSIGFYVYTSGVGNLTGTFKVYLKNTTDIAYSLGTSWTTSGFTLVDSTAGWSVPITAGTYDKTFAGGSSFTYTGGGLYIAWEFSSSGTPGTTAVYHYCNTNLSGGLYGYRSSVAFPNPTTLTVSDFRPATRLGTSNYDDFLVVTNVYTLGKVPVPFGTPTPISVRVSNLSTTSVSFDLTVKVKSTTTGEIRFSSTQSVSGLAANSSQTINFGGWQPYLTETDSVIATTSSIPGETWSTNNRLSTLSDVNTSVYSYNYSNSSPGGYGFLYPSTGIFAAKYTANGTVTITGANLVIANSSTNTGNSIYAVLINSTGSIVAQTPNYSILVSDLGTSKSFFFPTPVSISNDFFYIGLAQTQGTAQWYPLGTFLEDPQRGNSFYTFALTGGSANVDNVIRKYGLEAVTVPCLQSLPVNEGFETAQFTPECWTTVKISGSGTGLWDRVSSGTNPIASPHSGTGMARYNSYDYAAGTTGILVTAPISIPGDSAAVNFWMYRDDSYQSITDRIKVYYNNSPGLIGATMLGTIHRSYTLSPATSDPGWYEYAFSLPVGTLAGVGYFIFEGISENANDIYLDDISVIKLQQVYFSIHDLYEDPSIIEGDTVWVGGYYTTPNDSILIEHYGDWEKDQIMEPHSFLYMEGILPPLQAYNGGYIMARGIVHFEPKLIHLDPADSMIVHLNVIDATVLLDGEGILSPQGNGGDGGIPNDAPAACDPCKFAILISGGWDAANNHAKYWENLVALYNYKVNSAGYCPENVMVNYFNGTRRDIRIPAANVKKADSTNIRNNFDEMSRRVAACTRAGTPATFQKMVTNHGEADGSIDLVDPQKLELDDLKAMEQRIIDSCCTTMYDEFLQCYGGYAVDSMKTLNNKNKTTIFINSNADHATGISPHGTVHPYLRGKIDSLLAGKSYPEAVVAAKLAYDAYLQAGVNKAHQALQAWRNQPPSARRTTQIGLWLADSAMWASRICQSRNVTIVPFKTYCEWRRFVIPPGGQLVIDFTGESSNCGNVTVYKVDPATGRLVKVKVWNWNVPGSVGYTPGNNQRVINGTPTGPTTIWIHNDNGAFDIRASANGNQNLPEAGSNATVYPGFSFGGNDNSSGEFAIMVQPSVFIPNIDIIPMQLTSLPARMGTGSVNSLTFTFTIDPTNVFWDEMQLHLDIETVLMPGILTVYSPNSPMGMMTLNITSSGVYTLSLGDMSLSGTAGTMQIIAQSGVFSLDCWGLRSLYSPFKTLNLTVFLESLYTGNIHMNQAMEEYGPHFGPGIADQVTIELHNPSNYANIEYLATNLNLGIDGTIQLSNIPSSINGLYYITVRHRNSIETTTTYPVSFSGNTITYDFSSSASHAYGSNLKLIGDRYCIYGGDVTQDGLVDSSDMILIDNDASNFATGYIVTDANGDGLIDAGDMIMIDNNASGFVSSIHP